METECTIDNGEPYIVTYSLEKHDVGGAADRKLFQPLKKYILIA